MGEIRKDQKAKLAFMTADNSEKEIECLIKDVYSDRLSLRFPQEILSYANYLQEGDEIPVRIFTPTGIKVFDAMILNSPLENEFVIEYIENSQHIQRREYSRSALETKIIIERKDMPNIVTRTIDISGAGIRFFYNGSFEQDENVGCLLYLPLEIASIKAEGRIKYKSHLQKGEHLFLFNKISGTDRDRIVKKCFELEAQNYEKI